MAVAAAQQQRAYSNPIDILAPKRNYILDERLASPAAGACFGYFTHFLHGIRAAFHGINNRLKGYSPADAH